MKRLLSAVASVALLASGSYAQTTNGTLVGDESFYGAALSTQVARTGFGDASNPDAILAGGGSEIDQIFAKVSGGRLHVLVTGNLEDNFNKLNVFVDSKTGGANVVSSTMQAGVDSFCCGGIGQTGAFQRMNGLTFDAGFDADYLFLFTHGGETIPAPDGRGFHAITAHYGDLSSTTALTTGGLGMQLAPRGEPRVMRFPGDYNDNAALDAADYTVYRDSLVATVPTGTGADGSANGVIDAADYTRWVDSINAGADVSLAGGPFRPGGNPGNTEAILGPTIPGLTQGQLIDSNYAGGGVFPELAWAGPTVRSLVNSIDLRMALDNSNIAGVKGSGGPFELVSGEDNPADVKTGLEFSVPLSAIGNPGSGQEIKLTVFINGGGHDFLSNQIGGAGAVSASTGLAVGNLGNELFGAAVDRPTFNDLLGNQFVSISVPGAASAASAAVPEPASVLVAGLVLALAGVGRKLRK